MPTPLSTGGAAVSAFPEPSADVYATHDRNRKLAIIGAVAVLVVVGLSLAILGGTSSTDTVAESDDAAEIDQPPAQAVEPTDEPDGQREPADSASTEPSSVVAAPEPSASASAAPVDKPKSGPTSRPVAPRPPKGNYLPDLP
ncbi:MAG: hypothetical protein JRI68_32645 [Deltaproteobacteria bacterium]|nr:hypothetical protein [Deltaproteobacteria bacterium]